MLEKKASPTFSHLKYISCECPGGMPPCTCKHAAGVCYGLEEYGRTGEFTGNTSTTSSLCKWNAPPPQRCVAEMNFSHLSANRTVMPSSSAKPRCHFDARPENKRSVSPSVECEKFRALLESASVADGLSSSKRPAFLSALACGSFRATAEPPPKRLVLPTVVSVLSFASTLVNSATSSLADFTQVFMESLCVSERVCVNILMQIAAKFSLLRFSVWTNCF